MTEAPASAGLLGDTPSRDYSHKLRQFNAFAAPEIRRAIASLDLKPGMSVLDAGCGTGETLRWLAQEVGPNGKVVGIDLSTAHVAAARAQVSPEIHVFQADVLEAPLQPESFDVIWCVNTINHLRDPVRGAQALTSLLRPGSGRIVLGQSALVPDMYFAWDSRLERLINEAVRQYYRDRYGLSEFDLTAIRAIVGLLRQARLRDVTAQTFMIERLSPLAPADKTYLEEAIFRDTWGERLRPYLSDADFTALARLCDGADPRFALRRPDFHFMQSFTVAIGRFQP